METQNRVSLQAVDFSADEDIMLERTCHIACIALVATLPACGMNARIEGEGLHIAIVGLNILTARALS